MRIALLTLEGLAAASAVRRFVLASPGRFALVALSDPFRRSAGGALGQTVRRVRQSGPRLLPYLALNFSVPRWSGALHRLAAWPLPPERTPLRETCAALGVPTTTVDDVNAPRFVEQLRASGADLLVSFHFDQILKPPVIAVPPKGAVNVHCGLLSRHRGPTPTIHALLDPEPQWGITVHALTPRIDAGTVLAQALPTLPAGVSALTAARLLHEAALPLLEEVLAGRAAGPVPQTETADAGRYSTFPTPGELREVARLGRRTVDAADWRAAWRTPV